MNVIIETDRLLLRTFTEDDAALLFELNVDPEVTRYTHDGMSDLSQAKKLSTKLSYLNMHCTIMDDGPFFKRQTFNLSAGVD